MIYGEDPTPGPLLVFAEERSGAPAPGTVIIIGGSKFEVIRSEVLEDGKEARVTCRRKR